MSTEGRCSRAEEQCVLCSTSHTGHASSLQLLDVSGSCLVLEGARTQLATVVGTPSAHCGVCHSHCVVTSSCYTAHVLRKHPMYSSQHACDSHMHNSQMHMLQRLICETQSAEVEHIAGGRQRCLAAWQIDGAVKLCVKSMIHARVSVMKQSDGQRQQLLAVRRD